MCHTERKNVKFIFNSYLAKQLLNRGNPIVDLEKNYKLPNATIFLFDNNDKLNNDLNEIIGKQ